MKRKTEKRRLKTVTLSVSAAWECLQMPFVKYEENICVSSQKVKQYMRVLNWTAHQQETCHLCLVSFRNQSFLLSSQKPRPTLSSWHWTLIKHLITNIHILLIILPIWQSGIELLVHGSCSLFAQLLIASSQRMKWQQAKQRPYGAQQGSCRNRDQRFVGPRFYFFCLSFELFIFNDLRCMQTVFRQHCCMNDIYRW